MKKYPKILLDGIVNNNPTFKLVLGTCTTLALTTSAFTGLGMGVTIMLVLIISNMLISLLRNVIPSTVRIPCYVVIIATIVTVIRMAMFKFMPDLYDSMGIFLPLVAVNCVLLARAESFAGKNPVLDSAIDGVSNGLGIIAAMLIISVIREFLGSGTFFGIKVMEPGIGFFASPPGAFLVYGICIALFVFVSGKIEKNLRKQKVHHALAESLLLLRKGGK